MRFLITRRERLDFPDGINISIFSLAKALGAAGHEVQFLTTCDTDRTKIADFFEFHEAGAIHSISSHKFAELSNRQKLFLWLKNARAFVRTLKPDAIILNGVLPMRLPAPTVAVSHDLETKGRRLGPDFVRVGYKWWSYRCVDQVVVTCSELLPALAREISLDPAKISIIPTCFNISEYTGLPLSERRNAIVHIGTVPYKNPGGSINAFARMKNTRAELLIVGQKNPELNALIAAQPAAVAARIQVTGFLSMADLRRLLGTVRVVTVPSTYAVPVASPSAIEPLLAGTPIVCSHSISHDIIGEGIGLVVDVDDPAAVAQGLDLLTTDDPAWLRMSAAAGRIAERFSAINVARKYIGLFTGNGPA
jgi:glycosyltransferase involved in cell wall biosynthesis